MSTEAARRVRCGVDVAADGSLEVGVSAVASPLAMAECRRLAGDEERGGCRWSGCLVVCACSAAHVWPSRASSVRLA